MSKTVLFQAIQFSIGIVFIYKQLNVKRVLYITIEFSISTQSKSQDSPISSNLVYHKYTV